MPVVTPPTISALPAAPDPNDRATFNARAYPWAAAQATLTTEVSAVAANVAANATDAATSASTAATQAGLAAVDVALTHADVVSTHADAAQTALDRVAAAASAATASGAVAFADTNPVVKGSADATKQIRFEVDGLTTGTTRVITVPDKSGTLAMTSDITGLSGTAAGTIELLTGAAIASAATVNLDTATGNRVHITGTTPITAVTLTRGPRTVIFDGILTLTHHATNNNLPGAANITTAAGDRAIYESDGTTVYCVSYVKVSGAAVAAAGAGNHVVTVHTGNGYGSTNTKIRRFTTTLTSTGTAITYADSATLGATFTINEAGLYSIQTQDVLVAGGCLGISRNSSQLTTSIETVNIADRLGFALSNTAAEVMGLTVVVRCVATDVIRAHCDGSSTNITDNVFFSIRKVGT